MNVLAALAEHNEWANRKTLDACSAVDVAALGSSGDGYDSVVGILNHLVQVEYAFLEMAHGRTPEQSSVADFGALRDECARLDRAYIDHARSLDPEEADAKRFLVPWFGFEITLAEGVIQPLTHSHKHRADISMLLPRLGGEGVEMDFIQWLDERRDT